MNESVTPLIVFGDGPHLHSGLARIARDLVMRLVAEGRDDLHVMQVGVEAPGGWHWQPWDCFAFQPTERDQGRWAVGTVLDELAGTYAQTPVVLAITDPSRVYDLVRPPFLGEDALPSFRLWGYFPIDGWDPQEQVGGPAAETVKACERVLGYGRWGAGVLQRTVDLEVAHLPHGIEPTVFHPQVPQEAADEFFLRWLKEGKYPADSWLIGCVATNQPRKDLGLLFATVADLLKRGRRVRVWLHTDLLTKAWDIGQLAERFCLQPRQVCVSVGPLEDRHLAARYAASDVTIAPGLGEGFGYPIVESLACGTPVVHGDYAGGVELIPDPAWLVEPVAWRLESVYAIQRPVFRPADMAKVVETVVTRSWSREERQAYCAGSVAHLNWQYLWPRWRDWIITGLPEAQKESYEQQQSVSVL
jgi:glycosyltransferase involved in cell wall biosynthesis